MTDDEGTPDQPNPMVRTSGPTTSAPTSWPRRSTVEATAAPPTGCGWEGRRANATLLAHADKQVPADPDGPLYGPLAQGLALGALRALSTPDLWNTLSAIGSDGAARRGLLTAWGHREHRRLVHDDDLADRADRVHRDRVDARRPRGVDRTRRIPPSQFEEVWHDWLADHDYDDEAYEATGPPRGVITAVDEILCDSGLWPREARRVDRGYSPTWAVYLARPGRPPAAPRRRPRR